MPPRKRTKKAAEAEVSQAVTEDAAAPEFPLPEGDYFYGHAVSRRVHSGQDAGDRDAIALIQKTVGADVTGIYGADTIAAVSAWRRERDLSSSGLVDADVWAQMVGA